MPFEAGTFHHSQETKDKIAASQRGRTRSAETRAKIAASRRIHPSPIARNRYKHRRQRAERKALVLAWKQANPCVDCGESDPVVLDAHHADRSTKVAAVAALSVNGPTSAVIRELAKCMSLCANCHRRRTARDRDWSRRQRDEILLCLALTESPAAIEAVRLRFRELTAAVAG